MIQCSRGLPLLGFDGREKQRDGDTGGDGDDGMFNANNPRLAGRPRDMELAM